MFFWISAIRWLASAAKDMETESIAAGDFPRTRWSIIKKAGSSQPEIRERALQEFCEVYWLPLYAFARRRGFAEKDAEDVTQEFLLDLMARGNLGDVAPERGKLRKFLFKAMKNFMSNERDKRATLKRGGGLTFVSLSDGEAEEQYLSEIAAATTVEEDFDRHWVLAMLAQVLARLRANYEGQGKGDLFGELQVYLTLDGDVGQPYAVVAAKLDMSVDAVKTAVGRLRKRYRELIREEIVLTLDDGDDPDVEIDYLIGVVAG